MRKLQVIEHNNVRVLTTQQLAEAYETSIDNIKMNFKRNKKRFVEGRDYFLLKGETLKEFLQVTNSYLQISNMTRSFYLWTERGANRHSKILDTDKAWQQFDVLEATYFRVKNLTPLEMMKLHNEAILELGDKVEKADKRIEKLEDTMTIASAQQYTINKMVREKVLDLIGGKNAPAYKKISSKVFSAIYRDYKNYFKIPSYRDTLKINYEEAKKYLNEWQPETNLKLEIKQLNGEK